MSFLPTMPIRSLRSSLHLSLVVAGFLATGFLAPSHAQDARSPELALAAPTVDARWHASLEAFAAADLRQAPQPGGVLFVGSSSIRLWNDLETSFADQPVVIKRGFGGSQLLDCVKLVNRLVLPYKPRLVVVYAGENDIAEGATPQQVAERFTAFVQAVKADLPGSRIAYVSIKPSPLRAGLMPQVREANELIQSYSQTEPQLDFIDVYSLMLDASGQPRAELFSSDRLHMNAEGYALWRSVIASRLKV
jgi:lysophospholipase L1-like esterase